jgi:hypothetical protein
MTDHRTGTDEELKALGEAIRPYLALFDEFNKTPAEAVARLLGWYDALTKDPKETIVAMINSHKVDPRSIVESYWPGCLARYAVMAARLGEKPMAAPPEPVAALLSLARLWGCDLEQLVTAIEAEWLKEDDD